MDNNLEARRPLDGIRVLDLTVALAGPYGTLMLAGLGAEVIKVESPSGGDIARTNPPFYGNEGIHFGAAAENDISLSILARARSKKSISLDLKSEEGKQIFLDLCKHADIVFENQSNGSVERLGVDYETVRKINPRIIYCSVTGLGRPSPYPAVKAMDVIVQAMSGVMDMTGEKDGPPMRFGIPIADLLAPLYAVIGVQAALRQRESTGVGQHVMVSMLECLASLTAFEHPDVLKRFGFPPRSGNSHDRLAPFGIYQTSDGYVSIAAATDSWTRHIFEAMGQPELMADPRFANRGQRAVNADAVNAAIEAWTRSHPSSFIVDELAARRGVPCVKVRTAEEALSDPALLAARAVQPLLHPQLGEIDAVGAGIPIHMSDSRVGLDEPSQMLGASNEDVYPRLLGFSSEELAGLKARKII